MLCGKQFLYVNSDADVVNAERSMPRFPSGQRELLYSSFFQHDSKLNKTMKLVTPMISTNIFFRKDGAQSIQYSGSTNLASHASFV